MKSTRPSPRSASAFTLLEIMIVVAIISLLSAVAFPSLAKARKTSRMTRLATHLKATTDAFAQFASENNKLPQADAGTYTSTANQVPPGMATFMPKNSTWKSGVDGTWYYYYFPEGLPGYKGFIYLFNPDLTAEDVTYLDKKLDNGNINTGGLVIQPGYGVTVGVE